MTSQAADVLKIPAVFAACAGNEEAEAQLSRFVFRLQTSETKQGSLKTDLARVKARNGRPASVTVTPVEDDATVSDITIEGVELRMPSDIARLLQDKLS